MLLRNIATVLIAGAGVVDSGTSLIAFSGYTEDGGNIYIADFEGNLRSLTRDIDGFSRNPSWSLDGSEIAFQVSHSGTETGFLSDIWIAKTDGTELHRVLAQDENYPPEDDCSHRRPCPYPIYMFPVWSPHGLSYTQDYESLICILDGECYSRRIHQTVSYDWTSDGRFVYANYNNSWNFWIYNLGDRNPRRIINEPDTDIKGFDISISPDDSRIAFSGFYGGIWTVGIDGSDPQLVVEGDNLWSPSWSPDGTRISYIHYPHSWGDTPNLIYVVNSDGTNPHTLLDPGMKVRDTDWSPALDDDTSIFETSWGAVKHEQNY